MSISNTPIQQPSRGPIRKKVNSLQNAAILKVLISSIAEVPRSKKQLAEISGLQKTTVCRWINLFHVRKGEIKNLVYIAEWGRAGSKGHPEALWKLGYGMFDAPRPKPKTSAECSKEWRRKKTRQSAIQVTQTDKGIKHVAR